MSFGINLNITGNCRVRLDIRQIDVDAKKGKVKVIRINLEIQKVRSGDQKGK